MRELVITLEGPLISYIKGFVGDVEIAKDIVQDGFLKLWLSDEDLKGREKPWLYVVCRNMALDRLRRAKVAKNYVDGFVAEPESYHDSQVENRQEIERIQEHFQLLSPQEQEVLQLKFQSDLSYKEISEMMGIPTNQVGVVVHNGLKKLRTKVNL